MDGPGPAAVKASVDEGMPSREPKSSAAGAPVQLSEFEIAVELETFGPLTNSRNLSDLVHAGLSIMARTSGGVPAWLGWSDGFLPRREALQIGQRETHERLG